MANTLAIYIHWPYCARICPYCDFNVYKQRHDPNLNAAIMSDLVGWREWSGSREVTSIHFGGGTPSLMESGEIERIIHQIKGLWGLSKTCEIAIEANPNDAHEDEWKAYAKAGINRLSLGVQSFMPPALKLLGRDHNRKQARHALKLAKQIFPSVSLDLIFGWEGQSHELLQEDMNIALSYEPDHISTYQLTIEPGTAFAKAEARGEIKAVGEDPSAKLYNFLKRDLKKQGYEHYEVSNFAKPGHQSRHNLSYWRGEDYVGVGPGAHGRLTKDGQRFATIAAMRPQDYHDRVQETGLGLMEKEALSPQEWGDEYVLMGLRIEDGISLARYQNITGSALPADALNELIEAGLLLQNDDRLKATEKGRLVLNALTEKLLT